MRGAAQRPLEPEDGGFRGLPGGQRRDASAGAQPPLGEVSARAQSYGERVFGKQTGSGLLAVAGREWGGRGVRVVGRSRPRARMGVSRLAWGRRRGSHRRPES